jgi:hypothetical protein
MKSNVFFVEGCIHLLEGCELNNVIKSYYGEYNYITTLLGTYPIDGDGASLRFEMWLEELNFICGGIVSLDKIILEEWRENNDDIGDILSNMIDDIIEFLDSGRNYESSRNVYITFGEI